VACCFPLVLVPVPDSGGCVPFVLEGSTLVGRRGPAEGADASGDGLLRGSPRGIYLPLRRARIFLVLSCFQFLNARVDRGQAPPDLLTAALRRPRRVVHASSMPGCFQRPALYPGKQPAIRLRRSSTASGLRAPMARGKQICRVRDWSLPGG
jgi:hypothetical protein